MFVYYSHRIMLEIEENRFMTEPQVQPLGPENPKLVVGKPLRFLQEYLRTNPPALTPEEGEELDRIIWDERMRNMTNFENLLTR